MDLLAETDASTILAGRAEWADEGVLRALAEYPLDSIETEYPHVGRTVEGPDDVIRPSEDHPIFYGCYDWHSAVHNHWCLVRQLRLFPEHPRRSEIGSALDGRFPRDAVEQEAAYFTENESFEKPYGWAWLLRLCSEIHLWDSETARGWRERLTPLETQIRHLVETEFLTQDRPFRVGTHQNTAFALLFVLDYARVIDDDELDAVVRETAREFFVDDREYPVEYEPLGWDFLSPALTEADLMRRVLDPTEFRRWFEAFVPDLADDPDESILQPVDVDSASGEGLELHFVGLNLAKAWSMVGIADALEDPKRSGALRRGARRHVDHSLPLAFTDDYAGAHWLSSFVLYLITRTRGGIAPWE